MTRIGWESSEATAVVGGVGKTALLTEDTSAVSFYLSGKLWFTSGNSNLYFLYILLYPLVSPLSYFYT